MEGVKSDLDVIGHMHGCLHYILKISIIQSSSTGVRGSPYCIIVE